MTEMMLMCALCAALGSARYWTDAAGREEFERAGNKVTRRQERMVRVRIANRVLRQYGLFLYDWGGSSYVLENRSGQNEMVYHLNGVWSAAERLCGRPCDPLDSVVLERLSRELAEAGDGRS